MKLIETIQGNKNYVENKSCTVIGISNRLHLKVNSNVTKIITKRLDTTYRNKIMIKVKEYSHKIIFKDD